MSKTKECPSCSKEVSKSAKKCPHCGHKLKMGIMLKMLITIAVLVGLGMVLSPSAEDKAKELTVKLNNMANAQPEKIYPNGKLKAIFAMGGNYTDIQRDNKEKEIQDKIVSWRLSVYEVSKRDENIYKIQTRATSKNIGTFITIHARSPEEASYLEGLKTGNIVSFKGRIDGTTMRNISIKDAVLVSK